MARNFTEFFPTAGSNSQLEQQTDGDPVSSLTITQSGDDVTVTASSALFGDPSYNVGRHVSFPQNNGASVGGVITSNTSDTVLVVKVDVPDSDAVSASTGAITPTEPGSYSITGDFNAPGNVNIGTGDRSEVNIGNTGAGAKINLIGVDGTSDTTEVLALDPSNNVIKTSKNSFGSAPGKVAAWAEGDSSAQIPPEKIGPITIGATATFAFGKQSSATFTDEADAINKFGTDWNAGSETYFNIPGGTEITNGLIYLQVNQASPAIGNIPLVYTGGSATFGDDNIQAEDLHDITHLGQVVEQVSVGNGVGKTGADATPTIQLDPAVFDVAKGSPNTIGVTGEVTATKFKGPLEGNADTAGEISGQGALATLDKVAAAQINAGGATDGHVLTATGGSGDPAWEPASSMFPDNAVDENSTITVNADSSQSNGGSVSDSGDVTINVQTPDVSSFITPSSADTLTNKSIDGGQITGEIGVDQVPALSTSKLSDFESNVKAEIKGYAQADDTTSKIPVADINSGELTTAIDNRITTIGDVNTYTGQTGTDGTPSGAIYFDNDSTTTWHHGDVAILADTSVAYLFTGTEGATSPSLTNDFHQITSVATLTGLGITASTVELNQLNGVTGLQASLGKADNSLQEPALDDDTAETVVTVKDEAGTQTQGTELVSNMLNSNIGFTSPIVNSASSGNPIIGLPNQSLSEAEMNPELRDALLNAEGAISANITSYTTTSQVFDNTGLDEHQWSGFFYNIFIPIASLSAPVRSFFEDNFTSLPTLFKPSAGLEDFIAHSMDFATSTETFTLDVSLLRNSDITNTDASSTSECLGWAINTTDGYVRFLIAGEPGFPTSAWCLETERLKSWLNDNVETGDLTINFGIQEAGDYSVIGSFTGDASGLTNIPGSEITNLEIVNIAKKPRSFNVITTVSSVVAANPNDGIIPPFVGSPAAFTALSTSIEENTYFNVLPANISTLRLMNPTTEAVVLDFATAAGLKGVIVGGTDGTTVELYFNSEAERDAWVTASASALNTSDTYLLDFSFLEENDAGGYASINHDLYVQHGSEFLGITNVEELRVRGCAEVFNRASNVYVPSISGNLVGTSTADFVANNDSGALNGVAFAPTGASVSSLADGTYVYAVGFPQAGVFKVVTIATLKLLAWGSLGGFTYGDQFTNGIPEIIPAGTEFRSVPSSSNLELRGFDAQIGLIVEPDLFQVHNDQVRFLGLPDLTNPTGTENLVIDANDRVHRSPSVAQSNAVQLIDRTDSDATTFFQFQTVANGTGGTAGFITFELE